MANTSIKFYKVASMPEALTVGGIYFNDADHTIRIATSATASTIYAGIKDATYTDEEKVLTITKSDDSKVTVDLSDVASATKIAAALNTKVDKVDGKGLSTNDYTTDEKNKLSGIAAGAQVNVIESVKVNGSALTVTDKAVNITIPAATVTGVDSADKFLSLSNKNVKSEIGLKYDNVNKKIQLTGKGSSVVAEIDATAFIKDGMLESAELVKNPVGQAAGTYLKLAFNIDSGITEPMYVNVTELIDVYTAGTGITISGKAISVNKDTVDGWIDTKVNAAKDEINGTIDALDATSIDLATGFAAATTYAAPAAGDTVQAAISKLTKGVADAKVSGVTSFGGQSGAITVDTANTTNGNVKFAMDGKNLKGSVVGLKSAAYTESSAYATAAQGAAANSAVQTVRAANSGTYISVAAEKKGTTINLTPSVVVKEVAKAASDSKGLAEASDVKSYVDSKVAAALVWETFE